MSLILPKGRRLTARPTQYERLLSQPIADDPRAQKESYKDWEFDHGQQLRFYVGGMRWFFRNTGIDKTNELAPFGENASKMVSQIGWSFMPNSKDLWFHCALPQFRAAREGRPQFFQKAALVILACELALEAKLARGDRTPQPVQPDDIYANMSVVPSTWHIGGFSPQVWERALKVTPDWSELLTKSGQDSRRFIDAMATGHTVTWNTANAVRQYLLALAPDLPLSEVRARPGSNRKSRSATEMELIDLG